MGDGPQDENWRAALVKFLDALTELAKLGTKALTEDLNQKNTGARK